MIEKVPPKVENREVEDSGVGTLPDGRYLLFDSGCSDCTGIARSVEQEAEGWLKILSLNDETAQRLIAQVRPNWEWEPTLLEISGGRTAVFTGARMKLRLAMGLGPRRAARLARIALRGTTKDYRYTLAPSAQDPGKYTIESVKQIDRRTALKAFGTFGVAAAVLPWASGAALAQDEDEKLRVESYQMSSREAEKEFERAAKRNSKLKRLEKHLRDKGFTLRFSQQGTKVRTINRNGKVRRVNASWINRSYRKRNGETAVLSVRIDRIPNPDKVTCDYSIYTRGGGWTVGAGGATRSNGSGASRI